MLCGAPVYVESEKGTTDRNADSTAKGRVMNHSDPRNEPQHSPVRVLKIEADGDPWKGLIKPKIRLVGRWLERAGFIPGDRVQVTCIGRGFIELRSSDSLENEGKRRSS